MTGRRTAFVMVLMLIFLVVVAYPVRIWVEGDTLRRDYRIVVILKSLDPDIQFWKVAQNGAETAAKDYQVNIEIRGTNSETDVEEQIALLREVGSTYPDAIVMAALDFEKLSPVTDELAAAGIRLITFDSGINSRAPLCHIATDNVAAGREAGLILGELIQKESKVLVLSYVIGAMSQMDRDTGVRQGLAESGNGVLLETIDAAGSERNAYQAVWEQLQADPQIKGVAGLNEGVTRGAARAIKELGLSDKVHLVGFDNAKDEVRFMEEGIIDALVVQKPFNMGYLGVQTAVQVLEGKVVEGFIDTGSVLITVENMDHVENQKWLFPFVGN